MPAGVVYRFVALISFGSAGLYAGFAEVAEHPASHGMLVGAAVFWFGYGLFWLSLAVTAPPPSRS